MSRSIKLPIAMILTFACITVTGCRSITRNESAFLDSMMRYSEASRKINLSEIRVVCKDPRDRQVTKDALAQIQKEIGKQRAALEISQIEKDIQRKADQSSAMTLGNVIYFRKEFCRSDYANGWDSGDPFAAPQGPLFAHEVLHVWQWQNRSTTGFSLWKVTQEHCKGCEPYVYRPLIPGKPFLKYRFEQQGQMVQDYVEFTISGANPELRAQLRKLIREALDIDEILAIR